MPRHPGPAAQEHADTLNHDVLAADSAALTLLGTRSAEVADIYGDGLAYDRARIVHEARFYMAQSAEAMLEAGKRLIQIKENEPHGEFVAIVTEQLGIGERSARLLMQAAIKYLAPSLESKRQALAVLGRTKLFDLMAEDDGELAELAEGGTVAGLNLDDMQSMSSRELRAALVEARKRAADKDRVIAKKDEKLNSLAEAEERRRSASRSEAETQHLADLRDATLAVEAAFELLLSKLDEVMAQPPTEACGLAARQTLDYVAQRLVDASNVRGMQLNLDDLVLPAQMQVIRDAVVAAHAAKPGKPAKA